MKEIILSLSTAALADVDNRYKHVFIVDNDIYFQNYPNIKYLNGNLFYF